MFGRSALRQHRVFGASHSVIAPPPDVEAAHSPPDEVLRTRRFLDALFGPLDGRRFAVRYWDGLVDAPEGPSDFTLVLCRPDALRRMLLPPSELSLGEAYIRGDVDVEGNLEQAIGLGKGLAARLTSPTAYLELLTGAAALPGSAPDGAVRGAELHGRRHSPERDAAAIHHHYDVGNDFYALWLDKRMVYSCGYFEDPDGGLDAAQVAKIDLICRKLLLEPGETLLDIGCGWGGLIMHAAARYGVRATGITLSEEQAAFARRRIAESGLAGRCEVEVRDYRDVPADRQFDKVVSVGMFEHVGRSRLPDYFGAAFRLTKPGGLFLNHGIVLSTPMPSPLTRRWLETKLWRSGAFINRYVFPDGELVTSGEAVTRAEAAGFEVRDLENLREHYARTLRAWVRRLECRHADAVRIAGEQVYRIWRLYMAASATGFKEGDIGLVQLLLSKTTEDGVCRLPPTRDHLYASRAS
jgi:cyclopropane-fatty-acyl-phospholipid synthase